VHAILTDRLSAAVQGRYDGGWIRAQSGTAMVSSFLQGYGASVFLRYER
jgi:hypothetical protein